MEFANLLDQEFWKGVLASAFVVAIIAILTPLRIKVIDLYRKRKLKSLEQSRSILEWEKEHLAKIKRSSVALSRAVYLDIFLILLLISISLGLPIVGAVLSKFSILFEWIVELVIPITIPIWFVSILVAIGVAA